MHLDARGTISVAEVVLYVPILIIGGFLSFKNGFARKAGWIFLVTLSICTNTFFCSCVRLEVGY